MLYSGQIVVFGRLHTGLHSGNVGTFSLTNTFQFMTASSSAPLQQSNAELLQQLFQLLNDCPQSCYTAKPSFAEGCIGAHTRHILDYYSAFCRNLRSSTLNYCDRKRDPRIESDLSVAQELCLSFIDALAEISLTDEARSITLIDGDFDSQCESTVGRELSFLANHTLHHFASIAFFARDLDVKTPKGFGLAPSTARHMESTLRVYS